MMPLRRAELTDIANLVQLINQAYRERQGRSWTSEQHIIQGQRINESQLEVLLLNSDFELWVLELGAICVENNQKTLIGCIGLTHDLYDLEQIEIGTFAVHPAYQNQGLGRKILQFAERYLQHTFQDLRQINMYVLNVREELIAFYERAGYKQTGQVEDYPIQLEVGIPYSEVNLRHLKKIIERRNV